MKCNFKKFLILFFILVLLAGCSHYTLKPAEGVHYAARSPYCAFEIITNTKGQKENTAKLNRPHVVLGNIYPHEWWIWPWPPNIDYTDPDEDVHQAICASGADAIEIYGGVGVPCFRHARIRLIKWK